ncbi:MAG: hypothetical protein ABI867_42640 [Kofleriaceae bacterium]
MTLKTSLFMAATTFLLACGGGGSDDLTPAEVVDEQLDLLCERAFDCMAEFPSDAGFAFEDIFQDDVASCQSNFDSLSLADEIQASVDAGRIDYDSGDGATCNNFIDDISCDDFWGNALDGSPPSPAACDTTFLGTVADGGTCTIDLDCENEDSECDDATKICGVPVDA